MSILWGCFFLSTLLFKPPLFFLLCSFFLILALGARMKSSTQSLTSYPQPAVLGEGESLPWPQQGFKPLRGWRLEPQVVLGKEGGAGWHRGAWAQNQFWELGKSQGRRASIGRNQKLHVSVSVQRRWGSCECGGSMLKGLRPEPLNWKRQLPRDFSRLCSFREVCKGWYP